MKFKMNVDRGAVHKSVHNITSKIRILCTIQCTAPYDRYCRMSTALNELNRTRILEAETSVGNLHEKTATRLSYRCTAHSSSTDNNAVSSSRTTHNTLQINSVVLFHMFLTIHKSPTQHSISLLFEGSFQQNVHTSF